MKRVLTSAVLAGIATVALSTGAHAAGNSNAKIMLHSLGSTTKNICSRAQNLPATCAGYDYNPATGTGVSNQSLYPAIHFVYLLVVNGSLTEGIAGVQCGLDYNGTADGVGVDVFGWTLCATLEFASTGWPGDGGGNLITWNATGPQCLTPPGNPMPPGVGAIGVAGFFYMGAYTNDVMRIIPRPVDNAAKVANCGSQEDIPYSSVDGATDGTTFLGAVGFGPGVAGINPCGRERPVPVANTTWSGVKSLISTN